MKRVKYRSLYFLALILAVFTMVATGCANSKPSKFYLLRSLPEATGGLSTASDGGGPSILVGPITLPAYLDRPQIVTLADNHELVLHEFTRWAEPLRDNFYRVLVENLSLLLNTPEVYAFDRQSTTAKDFQITIDITRFDGVAEGETFLTAFWTVSAKDGQSPLITRKSVFRVTASTTGPAGTVDAQNRTLTEFSQEIAKAVGALAQ